MSFKIPNITFSHKVYLKSRVDWSRVSEDLQNLNWSGAYNSSNPVSELNKVIISLIDRRVPSKIIKRKVNNKAWFNEHCINAFHNKQTAYHLWSQNRSPFLWEEYVVHRRHA